MSVEKMTLTTLSGPLSELDTTVRKCLINQDFQPDKSLESIRQVVPLQPFEGTNPYREPLSKVAVLSEKLGITLSYRVFNETVLAPEAAIAYINQLSADFSAMEEKRRSLLLTSSDDVQIISQLQHLQNVSTDISAFFTMEHIRPRFGRIPRDVYQDTADIIAAKEEFFFYLISLEDDYVYCIYFTLPQKQEEADKFLKSLYFEQIWISPRVTGTPEEAIHHLKSEIEDLRHQADAVTESIKKVRTDEHDNFLSAFSYLRYLYQAYEVRMYAQRSYDTFFITGWIPQTSSKAFEQATENVDGLLTIPPDEIDLKMLTPPIRRKTNFFSSIFAPLVELYGLPIYSEIDPGFFLGLTYSLLFGMMFGDVGQGAVLIIIGLLLYKLKGMWLGRVISVLGISAILFGFVYGSVFGYEDLLPGFKVLESGNTTNLLLIAVAVGVVLLLLCMVFNIINGVRQHDPGKIYFSPNGLAGTVMYLSAVTAGVVYFAFGVNLFVLPYVLPLIVLPLLVIFAQGPLTKLVERKKDWKPESLGMFIMEGFFELFETLLAYISNTISFLRIGVMAISHAGMMLTVLLLSNNGTSIFGMIIGNIIVIGLETFMSSIQALRLEFYEMFGRFFESGGTPFSPTTIDYSSALNKNAE